MMTPDEIQRMTAMLAVLRADCASDTAARDGQPFDGQHVAQALGQIGAQVDALAHVLQHVLPHLAVCEVNMFATLFGEAGTGCEVHG